MNGMMSIGGVLFVGMHFYSVSLLMVSRLFLHSRAYYVL